VDGAYCGLQGHEYTKFTEKFGIRPVRYNILLDQCNFYSGLQRKPKSLNLNKLSPDRAAALEQFTRSFDELFIEGFNCESMLETQVF